MHCYKFCFLLAVCAFAQNEPDSKKLQDAIQSMAENALLEASSKSSSEEPLFQFDISLYENRPLSTTDSSEYR